MSREEWDLELAPEDFDQSVVSQSTQDEDYDSPDTRNAAKSCRVRKTFKMTSEEDAKLNALAEKYRHDWAQIAVFFPGKTHLQLKRRWEKLHNPETKRQKWTQEEDDLLVALYKQMGGSWKVISQRFPGRTPDVVKNHFYSCLKRTLPEPPPALNFDHKPVCAALPREVEDETVFSILALSPRSQPVKPLLPSEKLQRIQDLHGALTSLESMLLSTKVQIKKMEEELREKQKICSSYPNDVIKAGLEQ